MTEEEKKEAQAAKKAAREAKKKEKKKKSEGLIAEFQAFIHRGNVIDMAVGVIMGNAFGAIVTAVVNILLSLCTWAVPGGIKGLVTVLPAVNDAQKGMDAAIGLGQQFPASQLQALAEKEANAIYDPATVKDNPALIESVKSTIIGKYDLHGTLYTYKMSAVIDWGTLINSFISFLIIALVLFAVVKAVGAAKKKKAELDAKMLEEYYKKHPDERPVPPTPGKPKPTELDILIQIRDALAAKNAAPEAEKKAE